MVVLGAVTLYIGIAEHDGREGAVSLVAFGMAAFAYVFYVRRWKR
jgi:hypothetical protein